MNIFTAAPEDADGVAGLIAKFRVEILKLKNIQSEENHQNAVNEFGDYITAGYPIYVCKDENELIGYLVCRIDQSVVWVESLFVLEHHRKRGIASALYETAEKLAASYNNDTLYVFIHPNNDNMAAFLAKRGYNVLNLIEVRKKLTDENITEQITIRNNVFDY
jgi:GNAT superfamily N-acetyltransferase